MIFDGSEYFGPFPKPQQIDLYLRLIERHFPLCKYRGSQKKRAYPCLNYHMGRCAGACCGKITREEYLKIVDGVRKLLSGRSEELLRELREKMKTASDAQEFERAAQAARPDRGHRGGERVEQRVMEFTEEDRDYIALAPCGGDAGRRRAAGAGGQAPGQGGLPASPSTRRTRRRFPISSRATTRRERRFPRRSTWAASGRGNPFRVSSRPRRPSDHREDSAEGQAHAAPRHGGGQRAGGGCQGGAGGGDDRGAGGPEDWTSASPCPRGTSKDSISLTWRAPTRSPPWCGSPTEGRTGRLYRAFTYREPRTGRSTTSNPSARRWPGATRAW